MEWITEVKNKEQYPQKGQKGFRNKPLSEKVSKVLTVRLTEEQVSVMKKSLEHLQFTSMSDLTRTALLEYLVKHQDMNYQKNDNMEEMIYEAISNSEQRSEEWYAQRLGKFTASRFGDLMTNGRKKDEVLGQTAISYIYEKAAELLTGERKEIFGTALDWGNEYEPICKAYYSELKGVTIDEMPFTLINDYSGASPDGMVDGELIEIKCPYNTANHLKTAFEDYIDPKYMWQIQGQMLATGATVCRFISFDPRIKDERFKLIEIRVEADAEMQEQLRERLEFANDYLSNLLNSK